MIQKAVQVSVLQTEGCVHGKSNMNLMLKKVREKIEIFVDLNVFGQPDNESSPRIYIFSDRTVPFYQFVCIIVKGVPESRHLGGFEYCEKFNKIYNLWI